MLTHEHRPESGVQVDGDRKCAQRGERIERWDVGGVHWGDAASSESTQSLRCLIYTHKKRCSVSDLSKDVQVLT